MNPEQPPLESNSVSLDTLKLLERDGILQQTSAGDWEWNTRHKDYRNRCLLWAALQDEDLTLTIDGMRGLYTNKMFLLKACQWLRDMVELDVVQAIPHKESFYFKLYKN